MTNSLLAPNSDAPLEAAHGRWQWPYFYLTVSGCALAAAVYGQSDDVWNAATSFIVVWITAGLAIQTAEIWRALRVNVSLSGEQHAAWRFEALWRVPVAIALPTYYLRRDADQLLTDFAGAGQTSFAGKLQFVLFAIALIAALSSNGRLAVDKARRGWRRAAATIAIWGAVVAIALFLACNTLIPERVERVVTGALDILEPADVLGNDDDLALRQTRFVAGSLVASGAGLLVVFLARRIGHSRQVSGAQGALYACLTGVAIAVALNALWWLSSQGEELTTDAIAEAGSSWFDGVWGWLSWLLAFGATALAWRFTAQPTDNPPASEVGWRLNPRHYYHESRWLGALLFLACAGRLWEMFASYFDTFRTRASDWSVLAERLGLILTECVTQPAFLLLATVGLVSARGAIGWRIPEPTANSATFRSLPARRFAVVWLMLLAALAIEAAALAWLGFSLWHSSWQVVLPIDA